MILVVIAAFFGGLVTFITDYLWFKELGYTSVFFKQLFTQLQIGVPTFIIIMVLSYFYLRVLKRGYYKRIDTVETPAVSEKALNRITLGLSAAFGLLLTIFAVLGLWFQILKFTNSTSFGIKDPIFNLDVSFYIFRLEFITQLNQIAIGIVIAFAVLTLLYYFILLSMRRPRIFDQQEQAQTDYSANDDSQTYRTNNFGNAFNGIFGDAFGKFGQNFNGGAGFGGAGKQKKQFNNDNLKELIHIASNQLIVLGVIFFLMVGSNFFLRQYELLYSHTGVLYGAGFTDINITLWVYRAMIVLAVAAAIGFAMGIKRKKYKMVFTVPIIMIILGALGTGAAMLVQNLIVSPDEINKESPYLMNNIQFTNYAYDLQNVTVKNFPASNDLTKQDIANNMGTIQNIRINDFDPAKKFYNQTQSIRLYYLFNDVDVDRYMVNGEYTQTYLSAREIDESKIRQEWINKHLKYTHGYGITLSRVDKVTASGQPDMLVKSIPPVSDAQEIKIDRPEIYFGELTNDYILTNTGEKEFDFPEASGEGSNYSTYEGSAGIKLNVFNRAMFAIREQSLKLLVSTNLNSDSKIVINRNIMNRVQKIMPFLQYDNDPYIVTADGKLYWIIDAYTTSSYYPYSEPFDPTKSSMNYIRNSVKVVIDAYNGETSYYLVNNEDPIANTYAKIYPKLFKTFDQMPASLQAHIRYPNVLFDIQANVYKRYHMKDVKVFYQGEDLWDISSEIFGTKEVPMTPNYYIMKLPGENDVEFINSIPYTPSGKRNMTGLLVARNDGKNYGELVMYQMPKERNIYGPMQIESQIDQSPEISKEFSLWNSAGSTYIRGNLFVIPIEDSIVYVEPVYLEASNTGSLPEVKRVIVAYGDRIAYEPTLAAALDTLFGTGTGTPATPGETPPPSTGTLTQEELIQLANQAYENATAAQQSGDWTSYGQYLNQLKNYLDQLMPKENDQNQQIPTNGTK